MPKHCMRWEQNRTADTPGSRGRARRQRQMQEAVHLLTLGDGRVPAALITKRNGSSVMNAGNRARKPGGDAPAARGIQENSAQSAEVQKISAILDYSGWHFES